jgi:predicted N-acyltransferase
MSRKSSLHVRFEPSIRAIAAADWDACAFGHTDPSLSRTAKASHARPESISQVAESESYFDPYNPFVAHAFLASLEESGSVSGRTGWYPQHILVEDDAGEILAAMPCYLKNHSQGEYVFDHGWAEAYERAGGDYYPKLQVSVPFTPVTGPRLLVRTGSNAELAREALVAGAIELAAPIGNSIGSTKDTSRSTIFSPRFRRANGRRSGRNARKERVASRSCA